MPITKIQNLKIQKIIFGTKEIKKNKILINWTLFNYNILKMNFPGRDR